jgi:hypothetical protein
MANYACFQPLSGQRDSPILLRGIGFGVFGEKKIQGKIGRRSIRKGNFMPGIVR